MGYTCLNEGTPLYIQYVCTRVMYESKLTKALICNILYMYLQEVHVATSVAESKECLYKFCTLQIKNINNSNRILQQEANKLEAVN